LFSRPVRLIKKGECLIDIPLCAPNENPLELFDDILNIIEEIVKNEDVC